jgi:hypothetical protein
MITISGEQKLTILSISFALIAATHWSSILRIASASFDAVLVLDWQAVIIVTATSIK